MITVEEGKGLETYVDVVEGMQFDRGYLSPNFVTNADEMTVELSTSRSILIHEDKIDSVQKLVPLLEKVMDAKKPLLIIAEDVTGEALSHARHQQAPRRPPGRGREGARATATAARPCSRTSRC